jgi:hypothetical protein
MEINRIRSETEMLIDRKMSMKKLLRGTIMIMITKTTLTATRISALLLRLATIVPITGSPSLFF